LLEEEEVPLLSASDAFLIVFILSSSLKKNNYYQKYKFKKFQRRIIVLRIKQKKCTEFLFLELCGHEYVVSHHLSQEHEVFKAREANVERVEIDAEAARRALSLML
jgi:hypothetical protein